MFSLCFSDNDLGPKCEVDGTTQPGIAGGVAKSDGIPKLFPGLGGLAFIHSSLEV